MKIFFRTFHATAATLLPNPLHPLYSQINWEKVAGGHIAIVDPMDNSGILYLSEKDYRIQVRVSLSQDSPIVVLARPGDSKVDSKNAPKASSQNSPTAWEYLLKNYPHPKGGKWTEASLYAEISDFSYEKLVARRGKISKILQKGGFQFHPTEGWSPLIPVGGAKHPYNKFMSWHVSQLSDLSTKKDASRREPLVSPSREVVMSLILRWGTILIFRSGGPLRPTNAMRKALVKMGKDFADILSTRGPGALIMKMKNTLFFVNRYLSGQGNSNPFHLGEPVGLARSGLPRILPLAIRRRIAAKDLQMIRVITSLLRTYTVLEGPYQKQDLASILGPHPNIDTKALGEYREFCERIFWPHVVKPLAKAAGKVDLMNPVLVYGPNDPPYIPLRSGPNESSGLHGAALDAVAWDLCPVNWPKVWAEKVGDARTLALMSQALEPTRMALDRDREQRLKPLITGKISLLREPAGKVRSVAIVDYWTQRLMYPVHKWMLEVLTTLPGDATFDQDGSVSSYARETGPDAKHWSIDLKSATDLIPTALYRELFAAIWGDEKADLWISLLTDRYFKAPDDDLLVAGLAGKEVQYGRGQPMGTLSSWASMALVHHSLVLYSAWKASESLPREFTAYRVLGDDLVIGSEKVAEQYLKVTYALHVPLSCQRPWKANYLYLPPRSI